MTALQRGIAAALASAAFALAGPVAAQHADIELELQPPGDAAGLIVADPEDEALIATALKPGRKIFEAEFGEFGDPFGTDDPGFAAEDGSGFIPGSILGGQVLDELWKWDGSAWVSSGFDEYIEITDVLGDVVQVSAGTGMGEQVLIDAFDSEGGLHSHLEFALGVPAAGTPEDGAYVLEFSLFGLADNQVDPLYTDSDPFLIAFHLNEGGGFGEAAFEAAVDAFAPVPLPPAVLLFGSALAGLGLRRRKPRDGEVDCA